MKMKIIEITKDKNIYTVKQRPNVFERLFGRVGKITKYKEKGTEYMFGGGNVYYNQKGEELGNGHKIGESIDNWINRF